MIDTLMALWNLGYREKIVKTFFTFFLICISISLLVVTIGMPQLTLFSYKDRDARTATTLPNMTPVTHIYKIGTITPTVIDPTATVFPCVTSSFNTKQNYWFVWKKKSTPQPQPQKTPTRVVLRPTPTPTSIPQPTATEVPTDTPTPEPVPTDTPTPEPTPTEVPTPGLSPTPTAPAPAPTATITSNGPLQAHVSHMAQEENVEHTTIPALPSKTQRNASAHSSTTAPPHNKLSQKRSSTSNCLGNSLSSMASTVDATTLIEQNLWLICACSLLATLLGFTTLSILKRKQSSVTIRL